MAPTTRPLRVAIVGSGMAGLTTAMLLNGDPQRRYSVTIFESVSLQLCLLFLPVIMSAILQGDKISLDAASTTVRDPVTGESARVDVPMRAFAGGYYKNLRAMYDYLGVRYHAQRFLFSFSRVTELCRGDTHLRKEQLHFIHSSNNHHIPPIRPRGAHLFTYVLETAYLLVWYIYFSLCCFFVPPLPESGKIPCESFAQYGHRIRLPMYFISNYLLPLMSSVATCSHEELLAFPASDLIDYKRVTTGQLHYVVSDGVREVQRKLSRSLDIKFGARIATVQPEANGLRLFWRQEKGGSEFMDQEELFDRVVLAVSPAIVGGIFEPLRAFMARVPIKEVTSIVYTEEIDQYNDVFMSQGQGEPNAEIINFRTIGGASPRTESRHRLAFGNTVTTCPLEPVEASKIVQESNFTRALRTPESRQICNAIFESPDAGAMCEKLGRWRNGAQGIWLAGGWCWDGMVLLEGCIVAAMRVAHDFDVVVPWQ